MDPRLSGRRIHHAPPGTLTNAELAATIQSLQRKLRAARRALILAKVAGTSLAVVVLGAGFTVLWAGPAPFFERFLGDQYVTTTFDAAAWWLALILLAIAGGTIGDQLLRGKLQLVHGWRNRVLDLERRLTEAKEERRTRAST